MSHENGERPIWLMFRQTLYANEWLVQSNGGGTWDQRELFPRLIHQQNPTRICMAYPRLPREFRRCFPFYIRFRVERNGHPVNGSYAISAMEIVSPRIPIHRLSQNRIELNRSTSTMVSDVRLLSVNPRMKKKAKPLRCGKPFDKRVYHGVNRSSMIRVCVRSAYHQFN